MRICVDAGGTSIRIAYVNDAHQILIKNKYRIDRFPGGDKGFHSALNQFLSDTQRCGVQLNRITSIVISAAGHLTQNRNFVQFTNADWRVSTNALVETFKTAISPHIVVLLLNDFEALAYGLSAIENEDVVPLCSGKARGDTKIVCGPGTGLGLAALKETADGRFIVIPSEGGHQSFPPESDMEQDIIKHAMRNFVSYEDILSGKGLQRLYTYFYRKTNPHESNPPSPEEILTLYNNGDEVARETLETFSQALGTFCGNMVLSLGATKGVYLWGGVIEAFPNDILKNQMMDRFHKRGKMASYVADIPVYKIVSGDIALKGCSIYACMKKASRAERPFAKTP